MSDPWDWLHVLPLVSSVVTPFIIVWVTLAANDRRRALADNQAYSERMLERRLNDLDNRLNNIEGQIKEHRTESRTERKDCLDRVEAIRAQTSEFARRREMQDVDEKLWNEIKSLRDSKLDRHEVPNDPHRR